MSNEMPKTRRELVALIFKIAFLEAMALSLILPSVTSTGEITTLAVSGCNNPPSLEQCGTASCTPSNTVPALTCSITITFSPAFATVPKFASAQYAGCHVTECHFETQIIPQGSVSFQSDNGETWLNMPVASTEIYGTINHEIQVFTTTAMNTATLAVNCINGSTSTTATLRPQYSIDGSTWFELAQITGGLDVNVQAGLCGGGFGSSALLSNAAGIASAASGTNVFLRIIGFNGGGVGDNVVFNNIELIFYGSLTQIYSTCIQGISPFSCGTAPISKTSMVISILRLAPAISGAATSVLVNWIAVE